MTRPLYGAVDFGTGSVRLVIGRVAPTGDVEVILSENYSHMLGEDLAAHGHFTEPNIQATEALFHTLKQKLDAHGVRSFTAVGTESVRAAANGPAFMARMADRTGIALTPIGGIEELRYALKGAQHHFAQGQGPVFFAESGGGSTEIARVERPGLSIAHAACLPNGVTRLARTLDGPDITPPDAFEVLYQTLRQSYGAETSAWDQPPYADLFVAGAPVYLLRFVHQLPHEDLRPYQGHALTRDQVTDLARTLCAMGLTARRQSPYINHHGARWLVPAAAKLLALMDLTGVPRVRLAQSGVSWGLLRAAAEGDTV